MNRCSTGWWGYAPQRCPFSLFAILHTYRGSSPGQLGLRVLKTCWSNTRSPGKHLHIRAKSSYAWKELVEYFRRKEGYPGHNWDSLKIPLHLKGNIWKDLGRHRRANMWQLVLDNGGIFNSTPPLAPKGIFRCFSLWFHTATQRKEAIRDSNNLAGAEEFGTKEAEKIQTRESPNFTLKNRLGHNRFDASRKWRMLTAASPVLVCRIKAGK